MALPTSRQLTVTRTIGITGAVVISGKKATNGVFGIKSGFVIDNFHTSAVIPYQDVVSNDGLHTQLSHFYNLGYIQIVDETNTVINPNFLPAYQIVTDTNRPSAASYGIGQAVWNTSDNTLNWSDGTNWRDQNGVIT